MEDIGAAGDIGGEQVFEGCDVSGLRSSEERVEETLLLGGADGPAMLAHETPAGTGDELPSVHLTQCEDSAI